MAHALAGGVVRCPSPAFYEPRRAGAAGVCRGGQDPARGRQGTLQGCFQPHAAGGAAAAHAPRIPAPRHRRDRQGGH
eukprot:5671973-Pleurochrysis_carterae.AAC.1